MDTNVPNVKIVRSNATALRASEDIDLKLIPDAHRNAYLKAMTGNCSPRTAIKMKCYDCVGFEDIAKRVGECTCKKCPIWCFRPYKVI